MDDGRLIQDEPRDGALNMAIDEQLLVSVAESSSPVLRFYRWLPATVSLGYFQAYQQREEHGPSRDLPWVRRSTGGGAIVHDHELTYSLAIPIHDRLRDDHRLWYVKVHEAVVETLRAWGLDAHQHPGRRESRSEAPFLCFQRRAEGDVVVGDHKVLGSAQRRRAQVLLQHGSLLLRRSAAAPELPGILDLLACEIDEGGLISELSETIMSALPWAWSLSQLTPQEKAGAETIRSEKFLASDWNTRR